MRRKRILLWLLLTLALVGVGCRGQEGGPSDVNVDLLVTPDPPQVGAASVTVTLRDADGTPIGGATVDVEGTMTHAGMVPVFAQAVEADSGHYEASLAFTMGGDWVIIVRIALPDGQSLERQFDLPGVRAP